MQAAVSLSRRGVKPVIVERERSLGGKVASWHMLFPSMTPAAEVVHELEEQVKRCGAEVLYSKNACGISGRGVQFEDGGSLAADAVIISTGFELFDARIKEEYGYGIYDNVITSADLESMMNRGAVTLSDGRTPERIAILHCVGSRDEKVGQSHCSKVCCVTGVKQAIELKKIFPQCNVYNFYMDVRMFGPGYEEMYRTAQQDYGVQFMRGRISEVSQTIDSRLQIKAEDTLIGRPMKMTVDMLVLLVGMRCGESNAPIAKTAGIECSENGFIKPRDLFNSNVCTDRQGIFVAGAATAPKCIGEAINEGEAAAAKAVEYLNSAV